MSYEHPHVPLVRQVVLWGLLLILSIFLTARLAELHLLDHGFLQDQGDKRALRTIPLTSYRGMILDRNHEPLAISTPVQAIWVNPKEVNWDNQGWSTLFQMLQLNANATRKKIDARKDKTFVYLQRQTPPNLANNIMNLQLPGVYLQNEYRRFYPSGEVMAHVLGRTNVDHQGQEGMELAYEQTLSGLSGRKHMIKDRMGREIRQVAPSIDAKPGQDLVLSFDSRIQYIAYKELLKAVSSNHAKSGTMVVLDVDTFEVLAMVNVPSYNPNSIMSTMDSSQRNRAVTDTYEPGSLMKPLSMIHVLESGRYEPSTPVNTNPGWLKVGTKLVKDIRNYGAIDVSTVLKKSSNVGISQLVLSLPPEGLYQTLDHIGFGQPTDSGFPGEAVGQIQQKGRQNPFELATLAFGYGMTATPLQIAQAYAILAAKGIKRPISFEKVNQKHVKGEQVIPPEVAQAIINMLITTTETGGTALRARVPGYLVAGKTGTSRKVGPHGYLEDKHVALFAGFVPAQNPKIAAVVIIDEPQAGMYYGGQLAAPVFSKVMQSTLQLLNVAPLGGDEPPNLVMK